MEPVLEAPLFDGRRANRTRSRAPERLAIVGGAQSGVDPDRHTERLRGASEKIERLEHQSPSVLDPQLRHFLQRRSYSKALELLTGTDG
jgi:hypothetical protein